MIGEKSTVWLDRLSLLASLAVVALSVAWIISSGTFSISLPGDSKLAWHLTRSSGIVAYILLAASTIWGLLMSSQLAKTWSPGPVSLALHAALSWLALILALSHGLLLLLDDYFAYTLREIFVPFIGPYRPESVGLGTLAFWLIVIVTISFPLKKRIGRKIWKRLHYLSYVTFALVSAHGLFAGTDGETLGFRVLVGGGLLMVMMLLGIRLGKDQASNGTPSKASRTRAKQTSVP